MRLSLSIRSFVLAGFGGILAGSGFIIPFLWVLALTAFVPLIFSQQRWRYALIFAFGYSGTALFTLFFDLLPLSWIHTTPIMTTVALTILLWLVGTISAALPLSLALSLPRAYMMALPSAWVAAELAGTYFLSLTLSGPSTLFGFDFAAINIGTLLADDFMLRQAAAVGGVYLLSWIVLTINVGITSYILFPRYRPHLRVAGALLLVLWLLGHIIGLPKVNGVFTISALGMQTAATYPLSPEQLRSYHERIEAALATTRASIRVLPENTAFLTSRRKTQFQDYSTIFLDSRPVRENGRLFRRIEVFDTVGGRSEYSYKRFLVVTGEYVPYVLIGPARALGYAALVQTLRATREYYPGEARVVSTRLLRTAVLSCNEVMSPWLYRALVRDGAEVLINMASLAWYHESHSVFTNLQRAARIRATETRRFYIQSNDAAPAFILDPYGRTVAQTPWSAEGAAEALIAPILYQTPYVRFGPWIILVLVMVPPLFLVRESLRRGIVHACWKRQSY